MDEIKVLCNDKPLRQLNRIAKRPKLDVEFRDLSYTIGGPSIKSGSRKILKSLNGKFRCGEFTAILGPSGAGKTTLLNVLAGCVCTGVQGEIRINQNPRELTGFHKLASYIQQEDVLQPFLTVKESMIFAVRLKLAADIAHQDKLAAAEEVLQFLGLEACADTLSQHLSGGQRKRLCVALELVNNPAVIFLDEATSGLDSFNISQCISLLKKISQLDRTVVCTIHQPPASLFQFFDQVYVVSDGRCVFNGSPSNLVPFCASVGYPCSPDSTPAEHIIELVNLQPALVPIFQRATQNGRLKMDESNEMMKREDVILKDQTEFAVSFNVQFCTLLSRMFLQTKQNKRGLVLQILYYLVPGVVTGSIFFGIGQNAAHAVTIHKWVIFSAFFVVYTQTMAQVLLFPLEMKLLKREHFNRWYSLKAYYAALSASTVPLLILVVFIFSSVIYVMTDQPMEIDRFVGFFLIILIAGLTAQGLGHCFGTVLNMTNGSVIGPALLASLLILCAYDMGNRNDKDVFHHLVLTFNFLKQTVIGLSNTVLYKRGDLKCPEREMYCHYTKPETLMLDMAHPFTDYKVQLGILSIFLVIFRVGAYLLLKGAMNEDLRVRVLGVLKKVEKLLM